MTKLADLKKRLMEDAEFRAEYERAEEEYALLEQQYKSDALAAVHEAAAGLAEAGVMPKQTMRAFDEMCLTPVKTMMPEEIRALRLREK